jgi:hypothetical protein
MLRADEDDIAVAVLTSSLPRPSLKCPSPTQAVVAAIADAVAVALGVRATRGDTARLGLQQGETSRLLTGFLPADATIPPSTNGIAKGLLADFAGARADACEALSALGAFMLACR